MNDFSLNNVIFANQEYRPQRILVYGPHGLGKTTFSSTFEKAILARIEDGAQNLSVPTFPGLIEAYPQMFDVIDALHEPGHPYKTLGVDSLDWLEPLVWAQLLANKKEEDPEKYKDFDSIEDFGYGKGYAMADNLWRSVLAGFDSLRNNMGMQIVLIAHLEAKNVSLPTSEPFDQYQIKLHKRANELFQEWADMILLLDQQTVIKKDDVGFNRKVARGTGQGQRVIFTDHRPAYKAKNRWSLPSEIYIGQDKTWSAFHTALQAATEGKYVWTPPAVENERPSVYEETQKEEGGQHQ